MSASKQFRRWGLAVSAGLMALSFVGAPAMADEWRHDRGRDWHHEGPPPGWGREHREWRHHYVPPPVVYAPPPRAYYAPPPVVYAPPPTLSIILPIQIR